MLKPGEIAIVSGARTPFGRYCGKIKGLHRAGIGRDCRQEPPSNAPRLILKNSIMWFSVMRNRHPVMRCIGARHVGLRAGLPIETPGTYGESAVRIGHAGDRQCGADGTA